MFADLTPKATNDTIFSTPTLSLRSVLVAEGVRPHDVDAFRISNGGEGELLVFTESEFPADESDEFFDFGIDAPSERDEYRLAAYDVTESVIDGLRFAVEIA